MPDDLGYLQTADEAIERGDAEAFGDVLEELMEDEIARAALHEAVHGLARGVTVHVLPEDEGLSPTDAARRLGVSRTVVRKLMDSGELPYRTKIGTDRRLIAARDVVRIRRQHEVTQALARTSRRATTAAAERGLDRDALAKIIAAREVSDEDLGTVDRLLAQAAESDTDPTTAFLRATDHVQ